MDKPKPHVKYSRIYGLYVCRQRGKFNGYGYTPIAAYGNFVKRNSDDW